jgi:dienelactone hydrolase
LAHGDGGSSNDATLNDQCNALAQEGYVAITTSYRPLDVATNPTYASTIVQFKTDIESVIQVATTTYGITRDKVIMGGLSRGGNCTYALVLPEQTDIVPLAGIKGVILQCSGGDEWGGSAILFPVAYMSNKVDNAVGVVDANSFKNGLQNNKNATVKNLSECLIINSTGHCTNADQYKPFILKKVKEWLP